MTTEEKIWSYLKGQGMTDASTAGLMGNLYAESGLLPNNLQNSYEGKLGMTDAEYTEMVDHGTYTNFANDKVGYGLCQWTYWSRKQALLDYARATGGSIGDLEMHLGLLMQELTESYKLVLYTLRTATDVQTASNMVLLQFEKPASINDPVEFEKAKEACRRRHSGGHGGVTYEKWPPSACVEASGKSSAVGRECAGLLLIRRR